MTSWSSGDFLNVNLRASVLIRRLSAVFLAALIVAGAAGTADAKHRVVKTPVNVQFLGWASGNAQVSAFTKVLDNFQKAYPYIKVDFTPITPGDYSATANALLLQTSAPDVFEVDAGWMSDFASTKHLQREDTYAKADKSFKRLTFVSSVKAAFRYKGAQYAYPTGYTTLGLIFDRTMLTAAGYKSAPRTWKSLPTVACKLTNSTNGVYGAVLSPDAFHWFGFLGGFGGQVLNNAGTAAVINSKQNIAALGWYSGMFGQDCAEAPPSGSSDVQEFGSGHAAMTIEPSTIVPALTSKYPHLKWGVVPLPKGPQGQSDIVDAVGFAMNANSQVKTADWKLIRFLNGAKSMETLDRPSGYIPGRSTVRPAKLLRAFAKADNHADNWAWPPGLEINAFPHVDTDIQSATSGAMTPTDAANDMENWLKQYLPA
jgi:ABC-type glycerol-3-phosphate transport system substrate-binding protein